MTSPDGAAALASSVSAEETGAAATGLAGHAAALQTVLTDLSTVTVSQLVGLFRQYQDSPDFADVLKQAFPQIVLPHAHAAATVTAQWFNELKPAANVSAAPVVDLPAQRIEKTIGWSLYAPTEQRVPEDLIPRQPVEVRLPVPPDVTLSRLAGSTKRMVFDASRDTTLANAKEQGWKWVRYASANACAFCRVMATRGPAYSSKGITVDPETGTYITTVTGRGGRARGTQPIGEKYHDHCRCIAVPVPPGETYTPPSYVGQWEQDYKKAWNAVPAGTPYKQTLNVVLAHMREHTGAH